MANNDTVPVGTLLLTVFEAIAEVFILCFAGLVLSWCRITDKATQRKLNVINVSLFTPALLFSKVAYSLTPSKLKEMWVVPIGFVLITGVSAGAAWVLAKPFGLTKSQRAFAMCAAMFQNSNSLVIALVQSMVYEVPGLRWGEDDTNDNMLGRALTYLLLYSTLGMMLRWSWGVRLLAQADEEDVELPEQHTHILEPAAGEQVHVQSPQAFEVPNPFASRAIESGVSQRVGSLREISPFARGSSPDQAVLDGRRQASRRGSTASSSGSKRRSQSRSRTFSNRTESGKEFLGLPERPRTQRIDIPEDLAEDSSEDEDDWDEHVNLRRRASESPLKPRTVVVEWLKSAWSSISAIMTVPMYAAILSMFIAVIPPLQAALKEVEPLERAIKSAGQCSIPLTMVVLGAFFYTPSDHDHHAITLPIESDEAVQKKKTGIARFFERVFGTSGTKYRKPPSRSVPGENKTVFVAIVSRMIVAPLILIPVVALVARWDSFEAAEDPVFILSAILLITSPPALTLAQLTQAASGDSFERLISKTISWSYAVLTPPLTLAYAVIGLICAKL